MSTAMSTLLLESFPVPPSFIPPSPRSPTPNHGSPNPPPSRPPSAPLPPVPGPSRISESDTILFLGSSRNSKYSAASRPDSIASVASARSNGANYSHSPNNGGRRRDSSASSISNSSRFTSSMSARSSPAPSVIRESYFEGDEASVFDASEAYGGTVSSDDEMGQHQEQLTRLRLSPMPPDNDHDHDSDNHHSPPLSARFPAPPPLSLKDQGTLANARISLSSSISSTSHSSKRPLIRREPSSHKNVDSVEPGDSISAISMHDLLLDDDSGSDGEFDVPTTTNYPKPPIIQRPPLKSGSGRQNLATHQSPKTPIKAFGMTLSPTAPAISHTPPTPQSPAFGTQPSSAFLPPSFTRLGERFSSAMGTPVSDATETPASPISSPSAETPLTPDTTHTPEPPATSHPSVASTASRVSPPPEAPPVEFPTQVQFPGASDPPAADQYVFTDDPLLLHRELRSARSRSVSHKRRLNSSKPTTPVHSPLPEPRGESTVFQSNAALPRSRSSSNVGAPVVEMETGRRVATGPPPSSFKTPSSENGRSGSPDIEDLIDKTPRPRRRSSASALSSRGSVSSFGSNRSRSVSRARKSRRSAGTSTQSLRHVSEGYYPDSREARIAKLERELNGFGSDDDSEGRAAKGRGGYDLAVSKSWSATDENLLEDDGSASDSSLDIHTPLPHLLLRDGVLSHKSKLLPSNSFDPSDSVESFPQEDGERPGSTMSLRSVDSKASLLKDIRDTPVRRLRHKDGRLLRGGLGLTTGLGWSDSEDEDAPSPLTRQVSSLIGSRRSSLASLGNGRPSSSSHLSGSKSYNNLRSSSYSRTSSTPYTPRTSSSLSRSHSASTLLEADEFGVLDEDVYASTTYHGYPASRGPAMPSSPPTSWHHGSRLLSRRDTGSTDSLASIPDRLPSTPRSNVLQGISRSASDSSMRSQSQCTAETDEILKTPSTPFSVSSLSIPPVKPMDDDVPLTPLSMRAYKDKVLPPLPNPKTGSIRRPAAPGLGARFDSTTGPGARSRSNSGRTVLSSSTSLPTISDGPPLPLSTSSSTRSLKQLQLPRYSAGASQKPVPVPRVTSPPRSPMSPPLTSPIGSPKPRTGTGMAYKKSTGNASTKTMSRIPSSPMLRSSSSSSGNRF